MYTRPLLNIKFIVVHHSATPQWLTVDQIRKEHINVNGWSDIGYHYLITKETGEWTLKPGRNQKYIGAHVLQDKMIIDPATKRYMKINNETSIGLCLIGRYDYINPEDKLINETAYALKKLTSKFTLSLNRDVIIPHCKVSYTACPGKNTMDMIYKKLGI